MSNRRKVLGVVIAVIVVAIPLMARSCATTRDAAEAASLEFRMRIKSGAYGEIVLAATPELRKSTSEADFGKAMESVRDRLGVWQWSEEPTWKVFAGTGGQTVTLVYSSHFERGTATEEFVWLVRHGRPALAGYHVKSSALFAQ